MPTVFDNIETPFLDGEDSNGLKHALKLAFRGDFCVGYFNLRGWRCIDEVVNGWQMPATADAPPPARLLVGMQRMPLITTDPLILGYVFWKYTNQKEMGTYYTKEDITGYISKNTILPILLQKVAAKL